MPCMFGHSVGRGMRKRLTLLCPFLLTDCIAQEAIDTTWERHVESVLGPCQEEGSVAEKTFLACVT